MEKRGTTDSKCYRLLPEKENIEDYEIFFLRRLVLIKAYY